MMTPEIILGPPGTGKTTTLLRLVEEELNSDTRPDSIGYVSFTRKAAHEAVDRACEKFRLQKRDFRWFRTLHSLCYSSLNMSNGDVLQRDKLSEFGKHAGIAISSFISMEEGNLSGFEEGDRLLFMENLSRIRMVTLREQYEQDNDGFTWERVEWFARQLHEYKNVKGLRDFTDMLQMFISADWSPNLEVLFVDEAQDLSPLQWQVVWRLAETCRRVVIAGDDDQAIYKWAGAAVDDFVKMEGNVRVLDKSYRVPTKVQQLADEVVSRIQNRRPKIWEPRDEEGELNYVSSFDEIDINPDESTLILGRNAYIIRGVEKLVRRSGVLYECQGRRSVSESMTRAAVGWERLRQGRPVAVATAKKVYEMMSSGAAVKRGFKQLTAFHDDDEVTYDALVERGGLLIASDVLWYDALDRMPPADKSYMRDVLRHGNKLSSEPAVKMSTIHGSKGGEADHVILMTDMAPRTFDEYQAAPEDEARVWYVAVTRARRKLTIIRPSKDRNFPL